MPNYTQSLLTEIKQYPVESQAHFIHQMTFEFDRQKDQLNSELKTLEEIDAITTSPKIIEIIAIRKSKVLSDIVLLNEFLKDFHKAQQKLAE